MKDVHGWVRQAHECSFSRNAPKSDQGKYKGLNFSESLVVRRGLPSGLLCRLCIRGIRDRRYRLFFCGFQLRHCCSQALLLGIGLFGQ
jgi:hypothetical protein